MWAAAAAPGGQPIGTPFARQQGGAPIGLLSAAFVGSTSIEAPDLFVGGTPVGGPASIFNIGGAPISLLSVFFELRAPIGGPVAQVLRGVGPISPEIAREMAFGGGGAAVMGLRLEEPSPGGRGIGREE